MPTKSNNDKKKEREAAGKPPKKTKQQAHTCPTFHARPRIIVHDPAQENAGKSPTQKKAEMKAAKAAKNEKKSFG